ncbi:hypothetical protein [Xanthomonas axonopodis]|uniref:hypothetical protein n=1 Tax=Xanthomonas axonopodis TaxID=53413 RepID=UPI0035587C47
MRTKTITATGLLILALCSTGCTKEAPEVYQLPDIDAATAEENKAESQKRGWLQLEPLAMVDAPEKK